MCLGCVVRVESIRQVLRRVRGTSLAGGATWASPREVPVAGTCDLRRSRGEPRDGGAMVARGSTPTWEDDLSDPT